MAEKISVGSAEITVARDADWGFIPTNFVPNVPGDAWKPYLRPGVNPSEMLEARVLTFVIRSQGKTILVDTGVGNWGLWRFGDGHLLDSLKAIDVAPEDVDFVLPTHLHLDHVGWNTRPGPDGQPVPTFPRARYLFQKLDWDYFTSAEFQTTATASGSLVPKMIQTAVMPLESSGQMDLIDSERAVTDQVTLLHTPGHTPGSVTVVIQSGGEAALLLGDAAHHPAQLTETDWSPMPDIDGSLSARSRKAVVEHAQRLNAVISGGHFNSDLESAFGRLLPIDGKMIWRGFSLPQ